MRRPRPDPTSAAIYTRVSTQEQAERGISMRMQERECRAKAQALGATHIDVYADPGQTSQTLNRPALQSLLARLAEYQFLIVWRLDRLTSPPGHAELLRELLAEAQVTIVGVQEDIRWNDPDGRLLSRVSIAGRQHSVEMTQLRIRRVLSHIASTGRVPVGRVYGYRREGGHLVPDAVDSSVVREVYDRHLRGDSLSAIAQGLNARGITAGRGGPWSTVRVARLLRNPVYRAAFRWGTEPDTHVPIILPGTHEAIVSDADWQRAQELLTEHAMTGAGRARVHFGCLYTCGLCGATCETFVGGGLRWHRALIICPARYRLPRGQRHDGMHIDEGKALAVVWRHTAVVLGDRELPEALAAARAEHARALPDAAALRDRLAELGRQRREHMEAYLRGSLTSGDLDVLNQPLVAEELAITQGLEEIAQGPEIAQIEVLAGEAPEALLERARGLPVPEQIALLRILYDRIEAFPRGLTFWHRFGFLPPVTRILPRYWSPMRGCTDLGF